MPSSLPFVVPVDHGSNLIHSVTDPAAAQDAATKNYVDVKQRFVARAVRTTSGTVVGNTPQKYVELDTPANACIGGHIYRIYTNEFEVISTAAGDLVNIQMYGTVDGTTPTVTPSLLLTEVFRQVYTGSSGTPSTAALSTTLNPATALYQIKILITYQRAAGSGNVSIDLAGTTARRFEMYIEDMGTDPGAVGQTNF